MPYNKTMTFRQWAATMSEQALALKAAILAAEEQYNEWVNFIAARNDATVLSDWGVLGESVAQAELNDLHACAGALHDMHQVASGSAVAQSDRLGTLRKFS